MEVFLIYHLWLVSGFGKEITKNRERVGGKQKILVMAGFFFVFTVNRKQLKELDKMSIFR